MYPAQYISVIIIWVSWQAGVSVIQHHLGGRHLQGEGTDPCDCIILMPKFSRFSRHSITIVIISRQISMRYCDSKSTPYREVVTGFKILQSAIALQRGRKGKEK